MIGATHCSVHADERRGDAVSRPDVQQRAQRSAAGADSGGRRAAATPQAGLRSQSNVAHEWDREGTFASEHGFERERRGVERRCVKKGGFPSVGGDRRRCGPAERARSRTSRNVLRALVPLASSNDSPVGSRPMTASYPRDPIIALGGEGFGSLLVHRTARRPSLENREITILGTNDDRAATYQQYPHELGQTVLRSEFESHSLAPHRQTFAQLEAYSHNSPKPLRCTRAGPVRCLPGSDRPDAVVSPTPGAARMGSCRPRL